MNQWLGHLALGFAWVMSLVTIWNAVRAERSRQAVHVLKLARRAAMLSAIGLLLGFGVLMLAFVVNDIGLRYVRAHSSLDTPMFYRIVAAWSGQEGSLLLWSTLIALVGAVYSWRRRIRVQSGEGIALLVFAILISGLIAIILFCANPFFPQREVLAGEGHGLSLSLRHWAMIVHPPAQLLGYACCAAFFASALGWIWSNEPQAWLPELRFWARVGWVALSAGLVLGARWAYVELGWGGYWAWDPVENASLLPWMACTGLVHSIALSSGGHRLVGWIRAWAILPIVFSLIGAWITRSGVVASVHAYAVSAGGHWMPVLLIAVLALMGVVLFRARLPRGFSHPRPDHVVDSPLPSPQRLKLIAVEISNGLILFMSVATLLGMLAPALSALFNPHQAIAVGVGYYERTVLIPGGLCVVLMLIAPWLSDARSIFTSRRRLGALIAHLGIFLLAIGVAGSTFWKSEADFRFSPGQSVPIPDTGLSLRLASVNSTRGDGYSGVIAHMVLSEDQQEISLNPELRFDSRDLQPSSRVAIHSTFKRDVYVALVGWEQGGTAVAVQVRTLPLVNSIWLGSIVVFFGSLLSFSSGKSFFAHVPSLRHVSDELLSGSSSAIQQAKKGVVV